VKVKAQRIIRPDKSAALFDKAYSSVATIARGLSGFKATGIYPLNPNVFTDEDFQQEWEDQDTYSKLQNCCQHVSQQGSPPIQCAPHLAPKTCISSQPDSATLPSTSSRMSTSFQNISPLPTKSYSLSSANGRKRQHSEIWISVPKKIYLKATKQKTNLEARKQNKTEMQGKEFDSRTRKKACAAPAIKSSRPK
jgi:hypothetical protein